MNLALIGSGARRRIWLPVVKGLPQFELKAVSHRDELSEGLAARPHWSVDQILSDDTIRLVIIATPTHTHAELIARCLAAHKHVVCEPTAAMESDEIPALAEKAAWQQQLVIINHELRQLPILRHLRLLLPQIGDLREITIAYRRDNFAYWSHSQARPENGGALYNTIAQIIDVIHSLGGLLTIVRSAKIETMDGVIIGASAEVIAEHIPITIAVSHVTSGDGLELELRGEMGSMHLAGEKSLTIDTASLHQPLQLPVPEDQLEIFGDSWADRIHLIPAARTLSMAWQAIQNGNTRELTTLDQEVDVVRVLEAIRHCAEHGRPVFL